jgi:dipeptidyl aminopeptidase/acylaminoacyl peptidase
VNPYFASIFRLRSDGAGLTRLTHSPDHHDVRPPPLFGLRNLPGESLGFSPDGRYFISRQTTPHDPEVTQLRRADGEIVAELGRASLAPEIARHYVRPEAFSVRAPEGSERLYGLIFFPADFDPQRSYPVVDAIYNGQQVVETPRNFTRTVTSGAQALAELGFIVVVLDPRGTPQRSNAFHEFAATEPRDQVASIADHVHVLRSLARTRPYMDLSRVGIYGVSNGGYAALRAMLEFPEFFSAGVSVNGSHDLSLYLPHGGINWVQRREHETWSSALEAVANRNFASRLEGRLLIMIGAMDSNTVMANSLGVVQALIEHDKEFELAIVPLMGHSYAGSPFATRKMWEFFVRHLQQAEPASR